jgi:uncharacterized membrane protein YkvA (DUF1232 family)
MPDAAPVPPDLSDARLESLRRHVAGAEDWPVRQLLVSVRRAVQRLPGRSGDRVLDLTPARRLLDSLETVVAEWESVPEDARPWLKGAMLYLMDADDEVPDDDPEGGFADDLDIVNACLRMAGRGELCVG